ncbi:hypothetical protein KY290_010846 [Solanum tuberosum]|uniref:DUF4218 domain-containing protein n=1 Tax=Solanum tuberosum TaxID=4113 RepID=A0ABQ7VYW9_SOLTU|nr:hypothetical protein KY290_010846 [Solanum tuberosum]
MEHLPIHFAKEAMIGGPVQYRSMFPVERWLYFLKLFIRNRSCVEGSIVEEYIANEFTTLCSKHLHTMDTKFNLLERNYDGGAIESDGGLMIFCLHGKALKGGKPHRLDLKEMEQAHIYILKNCDEGQPFLEEFSQIPGDSSQKKSDRQFINCYKEKKSQMGSSSKNFKQSFIPHGALSRGRGQRLKSMGSVRITAEKRNLIDQTEIMLETLRSKSEKEIRNNFTFGGSIKGSMVVQKTLIGKSKGCSAAYYDRNELASDKNLMQPCLDLIEDETSFPHENLEVMQETPRSKPVGRGKGFGSLKSVGGSVEKGTVVGNNKGLNSATSNQNVITQKTNVVPPGFDALEDETSFLNDNLEVTQETMRSKPAKENGQNITSMCSIKGTNVVQRTFIRKGKNYSVSSPDKNELAHSRNLMQPGFDPIEVDTFFPRDDLEVMGRGKGFTSLSSVRGSIGKRMMVENNNGLNYAIYDQNVIAQKTNVVCPNFDAIEVETSFPHDDHEVMQETMRRKLGKQNGKNVKSVGSARGSPFVQRTSIGKSKGYSVVSSDSNVPAHNKNFRQPDFNPIEHDTSIPHDNIEVMQEALRSKSCI